MANDLRYSIDIDGIPRIVTNLADLKKAMQDNNKVLADAKLGTERFNNALMNMNGLKILQKELTTTSQKIRSDFTSPLGGAQTASANASMALLNLNYVIRDSPYFFNNFALGVLAVGNNINPLIDSFNRLRKEALEKNLNTVGLLRQALVGGAGISIAFSVVVTAIQSFVFWQSRASKESERHTEKLKKEKEEVSRLRGEYNSLVRDRALRMAEDTSPGRLSVLQQTARQMRQSIREKRSELGLYGEDTINYRETSEFIKQEEANLKLVEDELNYILFAWQNVVNENEKDNKKIKEKISLLKAAKMLQPDSGGGVAPTARRGFYAGETTNTRMGMRQAERTKAFGFGGAVKELDTTLELAKIGAQELGSALEGAFTGAKIKLSDLINQITVAITKMLILQGITSLLTGGLGASASVPSASVGGKEGMWITSGWGDATRFKKQSVNVTVSGRFRANGKEFIADFKNAEKQIDLMRL